MKDKLVAQNIFWNTIGNIFYLGCQWLLSVVVVRISGSYVDAGVLTLAISVTNIFATLAAFSVRNYQVSDISGKYTQSDYISHRIITCSAALMLCIAFSLACGYSRNTALSIIAYMFMKTVEAFADVFHGILQKQWRLDVVGRSCIYRGALLLVSFTVVYRFFGNLSTALFIMGAITAVSFLFYDLRIANKITDLSCRFDKRCFIHLSQDCLPILCYGLFLNSVVLIARFFIERYHGEKMLGYYGSVSTVAVIVQAASGLILSPLNGIISSYYEERNCSGILRLCRKVFLLLTVLTGLTLGGAAILGDFVLILLFGESIEPYTYLLIPALIASCLTGLVWFLGIVLIIMRQMKILVTGAAVGAVASAMLSLVLIPGFLFDGANIAVIIALSVTTLIYVIATVKELRKTN